MNCDSAFLTKKKDKEKGFTLLEVIVAISVLTIGLLAVASMQVLAIKGNTLSFGVTEATSWASDQMEKLMALPYDHANLMDTDEDGTDEDANGDGVDDDGGDFGLEDNPLVYLLPEIRQSFMVAATSNNALLYAHCHRDTGHYDRHPSNEPVIRCAVQP